MLEEPGPSLGRLDPGGISDCHTDPGEHFLLPTPPLSVETLAFQADLYSASELSSLTPTAIRLWDNQEPALPDQPLDFAIQSVFVISLRF